MAHEGLIKGQNRKEIENVLSKLDNDDISFSYKDATDSPKSSQANRIDIFYYQEKIGEVWDPRPNEKCFAMIYSNNLTASEIEKAVNVYSRKYEYASDGTRVWNRHVTDMDKYHSKHSLYYNFPAVTKSELETQIKSIIEVFIKNK